METENISRFKAITEEMINLYEKKNHDYGNSFEENLDRDGDIRGGIARLSEKIARIRATADGALVSDESAEDTLIDIANYAVMNLMWLRKRSRKKKFTPKRQQRYYFVDGAGQVGSYRYDEDEFDRAVVRIGNCFETREEAGRCSSEILAAFQKFNLQSNAQEKNPNE